MLGARSTDTRSSVRAAIAVICDMQATATSGLTGSTPSGDYRLSGPDTPCSSVLCRATPCICVPLYLRLSPSMHQAAPAPPTQPPIPRRHRLPRPPLRRPQGGRPVPGALRAHALLLDAGRLRLLHRQPAQQRRAGRDPAPAGRQVCSRDGGRATVRGRGNAGGGGATRAGSAAG